MRSFITAILFLDNLSIDFEALFDMFVKSKNEIFTELGLDANQPTALLTYHPVTLEFDVPVKDQIKNIIIILKLQIKYSRIVKKMELYHFR